ncbi:MAG: Rieske 2Fe-2S domain-containing protein [Actinomycetota bacterium]|nr:Rieske 2Fe-2S domain-containing protein [Actinomycetota bacterium]
MTPPEHGDATRPGHHEVVRDTAGTRVADDAELWEGDLLGVEVAGVPVVLTRVDGVVCAYVDRCAHLRVRLSEGRLDGGVLTCRAHHWCYDATTGNGINPRGVALEPVAAEVRDGGVFVVVGDDDG